MNLRKKITKSICMLLATIITCISVCIPNAQAISGVVETHTIYVDNATYTVNVYSDNKFEIINENTKMKALINVNSSKTQVSYTEYAANEDNKYSQVKKSVSKIDVPTSNFEVNAQATYKSSNKVSCAWETSNGNKYWYNISTSSPKYVKIGCVKTYTKKYSKFQSNLDKYMDAILSCNASYNTAVAILGTTDATVLAAEVALIAAGSVVTDGALLAVLAIAGSGATVAVTSLGAAYNQYLIVKEQYELLK